MSELILAGTYEKVVEQFTELLRELESNSITTYWTLGALVKEFEVFNKGKKLQTVKDLAADLQANGVLRDVDNAVRALYWARALHEAYDAKRLQELVSKGLTLTHLKALTSVSDNDAADVEAQLFRDDGKPVTTREADDIIKQAKRASNAKAVEATIQEAKEKDKALGDDASPKSKEAKETKDSKKESGDSEVSPFKALKVIDKSAEKILANISEAFLAVNQMRKKGFDSDKAQKNWKKQVSDTKAIVANILQALPDLVTLLSDED